MKKLLGRFFQKDAFLILTMRFIGTNTKLEEKTAISKQYVKPVNIYTFITSTYLECMDIRLFFTTKNI